jgi:hypothetical protein
LGIIFVWTGDIVSGEKIDRSSGFLKSRDRESGDLMLPHWIAEYGTACGLVAGGIGLLVSAGWSTPVSLISLGALAYTSVNSLSWSLSKKGRLAYALPMILGAGVAVLGIIMLLTGGEQ